MPNTSASGGPLSTLPPPPLQGVDLLKFFQAWIVGVCGLPGPMVRPRWQAEPPNIPADGIAWAAVGVVMRRSARDAHVRHDPTGQGSDVVTAQEQIEILCSFYDLGSTGMADDYAGALRDGLYVSQNLEPLTLAGMGLHEFGALTPVPSLHQTRWLYRVDFPISVTRAIVRVYGVDTLASASGTLYTDVGAGPFPIAVP